MRLKLIGVACIVGTVAVAFACTSSAVANPTSLCKGNELVCPGNQIYPVGTHIEAELAESMLLLTDLVTISCKLSHVLAHIAGTAALANPLLISVLDLSFEECRTTSGQGCSIIVEQLGHLLLLKTASNLGTLQSHGTSFRMICNALTSCTLGGLPTLHAEGANGTQNAHITAEEEVLERLSGVLCPEEAYWDALYEVTLPTPLYISL